MTQSQASLSQAQVNLDHGTITAPIDGIVIQRSVDVGQTVAASMSAPTLFVIAADLAKMQVNANIDEADVGRIRPNQNVTFRVDAYPGRRVPRFGGADSPAAGRRPERDDLRDDHQRAEPRAEAEAGDDGEPARPDRAANGCRARAERGAALPAEHDMFAALNQTGPCRGSGRPWRAAARREAAGRGPGAPAGSSQPPAAAAAPRGDSRPHRQRRRAGAPSASLQPPAAVTGPAASIRRRAAAAIGDAAAGRIRRRTRRRQARRSGGGGGFGGRGQGGDGGDPAARMLERFKGMSPDEQKQFIARMKERGVDVSAFEAALEAAGQGAGRPPATRRARSADDD